MREGVRWVGGCGWAGAGRGEGGVAQGGGASERDGGDVVVLRKGVVDLGEFRVGRCRDTWCLFVFVRERMWDFDKRLGIVII